VTDPGLNADKRLKALKIKPPKPLLSLG